jgi:type II secretory pathway pseudopilin PulG
MCNNRTRGTPMRDSEAGVSMVELVIVGLVVAIVTAFTLPMVSGAIRAYNLRSAANHLAERISAVRALAMAKNRNLTFSFNNASGRYGFDFDLPPDGIPDTSDPVDVTLGGYYWETLPEGVTTTFPNGSPIMITFNSRGELPIGDPAQGILLQSSGRSATVSVNLRGRIAVQ